MKTTKPAVITRVIKMDRGKRLIAIIMLVAICPLLASCYDAREVDDLGFVIAMGLDRGKTNTLRMTLQIAKPMAGADGGSGGDDLPYEQFSVEAPAVFSGLNMINTFASKQISLTHLKVVVFSSELAREGLKPYLNAMLRGKEFRPNMPIVVARHTAEEYLQSVDPKLVTNAAKYYELVFQSYKYTGLIPKVEFHDFYLASKSPCRNPVAILGDAGKFLSAEEFDIKNSTYMDHHRSTPFEGDFFAGDIPALGGARAENVGLAVFEGDKMVGELDGTNTTMYLLCTGDYIHSYWTFPDPLAEGRYVLMDVKQSRKPKHRVEFVDGKPRIDIMLNLEGDLVAVQSDIDYETGDNSLVLESAAEDYIKDHVQKFLDKTINEFQSDICGFGAYARAHFMTWAEWEAYNWHTKYKDATFNLTVNFKVRRPGLILRSGTSEAMESRRDDQ